MSSGQCVYLNGEFLPLAEARVSVLDRGFVFGDGVYEVIPVFGGRLFRLSHHLQRLQQSLDAIYLNNPLPLSRWQPLLEELVQRNGGGDQSLYLQVTRGAAPRDLTIPTDTTPTLFVMSTPAATLHTDELRRGASAVTVADIRWQRCDIKAITLLANVLARQQAVAAGADEAIMLRDGELTEGSASNIFVVLNGVVTTPPNSAWLLPGITRDLVVELCSHHGIPCEERRIDAEELAQAEEIWLSSSAREIMPILKLDGRPVANGRPGPIWQQMIEHYQAYKQAFREGKETP